MPRTDMSNMQYGNEGTIDDLLNNVPYNVPPTPARTSYGGRRNIPNPAPDLPDEEDEEDDEMEEEFDLDQLMFDNHKENFYPNATDVDLLRMLGQLKKEWNVPEELADNLHWIKERFGLFDKADKDITMADIDTGYSLRDGQISALFHRFVDNGLAGETTSEALIYNNQEFTRLYATCKFSKDCLVLCYRMRAYSHNSQMPQLTAEESLMSFTAQQLAGLKPQQRLITFILNQLYHCGYKNYKGTCFEQIKTGDGKNTHAWREACSLDAFIRKKVDRHVNHQIWQDMTSTRGAVAATIEYLQGCNDYEFKFIKPDRNIFAFRNGIYITYKENVAIQTENGEIQYTNSPLFVPYEETAALGQDIVACKYHDVDFDNTRYASEDDPSDAPKEWYDLPTPIFQSILDHQLLTIEVSKWMYRFIGRLLYDIGKLDNWQVMPFVKGIAGSGKSTIGAYISKFYGKCDVATLSNTIERTFGLNSIHDKFMWICYEAKENFGLDQSQFQSMITGEAMSIPAKNKEAKHLENWLPPGMMLGNELPKWADASGSISRRVVMIEFMKKVSNGDPKLFEKLLSEIAVMIRKCNEAYLLAVSEYSGIEIWSEGVLPEYFKETRNRMNCQVNALSAFLSKSDDILVYPRQTDVYIPYNEFLKLYNEFCRNNNFERKKLTQDHCNAVFGDIGLALRREKKKWGDKEITTDFVFGVIKNVL